jgi:2'-5' RNA ligase
MAINGTEYCCLMVDFKIRNWGFFNTYFDPMDLTEDGVEQNPHCTVCYGLEPDVDVDKLKRICPPISKLKFMCNGIGVFNNEERSVIHFTIESPSAVKLNSIIKEKFAVTSQYPFHPHCTIAYLKPTLADKYIRTLRFTNNTILNGVAYRFSYADNSQIYF